MIEFSLSGLEDAARNLAAVVAPINDRRIGEHAEEALEPIAAEARRLVPKDSYDLHDTIRVVVDPNASDNGNFLAYVGPIAAGAKLGKDHVFYAHFVEYGTVNMRAIPFMGPAVHNNEALVFEVLGKRMGSDMLAAL